MNRVRWARVVHSILAVGVAAVSVVAGYRPSRARCDGMDDARRLRHTNPADRFWRELSIQDWIALVYLAALLAFTIAGDGPRRTRALVYLLGDLGVFFGALVLTRGRILEEPIAAGVYRLGLFAAIFGSFSHLQYVLPTARATVVDADLLAFDRFVFGFEPAVALDRFVTPATTEWFSFFYFGYFFLLAVHVFPFMLARRRMDRLAEFSLGLVIILCLGHLLYIAVPGYGPYHHLAGRFEHVIEGPFWWRLVRITVDSADVSSRTDIFPSLHTALPTYLAIFSVRHRSERPFRYTWLPLCLFASQIVISTMFLRWHYLIDVIAGLSLAAAASALARRVAGWESDRRRALGKAPVWTAPWSQTLSWPGMNGAKHARAASER